MSTLRDLSGSELAWLDAELWVERFLNAVATRHASGRGGPLSVDAAEVDGETIVLPVQGAPNSDLVTSRAAARVVWEWLGDGAWAGAGDLVRFRAKERWPNLTPEHIAVLDRACAEDAPAPAAIARLWSDVRERSGVALRPLRLQKNRNVVGLTTGQFDNALGPPKPRGPTPAISVIDDLAPRSRSQMPTGPAGDGSGPDGEPDAGEFTPDRRWLIGVVLVVLLVAAGLCAVTLGGVWTTTAAS